MPKARRSYAKKDSSKKAVKGKSWHNHVMKTFKSQKARGVKSFRRALEAAKRSYRKK